MGTFNALFFYSFFLFHIATYSASILHRVALHLKPLDYQLRLSKELKKSLRDAGVLEVEENPPQDDSLHQLPDVPQVPLPKPRTRAALPNEVGRVEWAYIFNPADFSAFFYAL